MSESAPEYSFVAEKGDIRMLLPGEQSTGKCCITYSSHPGYVLYTTIMNGKREGNGLLENSQGCSVVECFFHNDVLEGSFTHRSQEGALVEKGYYVSGKRDGILQKFDEDGSRREIVRCSDGKEVSVLHSLVSPAGYWEERSNATNEVQSVAKYTADFSSMDGLCFLYEGGKVKRGELFSGGRMERVVMEFDDEMKVEYGEGGERVYVGEYKNNVECLFCREGKGCVLDGGEVVRVNVYEKGEEKRGWKVMEDGMMTEWDENGNVVYLGEYDERPERFCPRSGRGLVYEDGELKRMGLFEDDEMERKEIEFDKGMMKEFDEKEQIVYEGGYQKNKEGEYLRDGQGSVYENEHLAYIGYFKKGKLKYKTKGFKDGVMTEVNKKGTKVYEGGFEMMEHIPVRSGKGKTFQWDQVKVEGVFEGGKMKQIEKKNKVYMARKRAEKISVIFVVVSLLFAAVAGWSYFKSPSIAPYVIGVCGVMEMAFMLFQYFTIPRCDGYGVNSITSLVVLLFLFCLALNQVTNGVYLILSIVFGVGIVEVVVISVRDDEEVCIGGLFYSDPVVFIGWCILTICTIKSPPLCSYVLLGWWFVGAVIVIVSVIDVNWYREDWITAIVIWVCLMICSCILYFVNRVLFYISLGIDLVMIILLICKCCNNYIVYFKAYEHSQYILSCHFTLTRCSEEPTTLSVQAPSFKINTTQLQLTHKQY